MTEYRFTIAGSWHQSYFCDEALPTSGYLRVSSRD